RGRARLSTPGRADDAGRHHLATRTGRVCPAVTRTRDQAGLPPPGGDLAALQWGAADLCRHGPDHAGDDHRAAWRRRRAHSRTADGPDAPLSDIAGHARAIADRTARHQFGYRSPATR